MGCGVAHPGQGSIDISLRNKVLLSFAGVVSSGS